MSSKHKLILAISMLVVVLIITSSALVFVLAAISQSVSSNVQVIYESHAVAGAVKATYTLAGGTETELKAENGESQLIFTGAELGTQSGSLSPESNIVLTSSISSVVFEYSFTNTGDANYTAMLSLGDSASLSNIDIKFSRDGVNYFDYNNGLTVYNNTTTFENAEVYYVKISIINTAQDASFSGAFSWNLNTSANDTILRNGDILYGELTSAMISSVAATTVYTFVNDYTITTSTTNSLIVFTADKDVKITKLDGTIVNIRKGEYVNCSTLLE